MSRFYGLKTQHVLQDWRTLNNPAEERVRARIKESARFLRGHDFVVSVGIEGVLSQKQVESVRYSF